jgi:FAD/FMN-containing dehydrogenase
MVDMTRKWTNWAGNQVAYPASFERPVNEDQLANIVGAATERQQTVKVPGSGHSFTAAALTDGVMIDIRSLRGIRSIDRSALTVTVGAGTVLSDLNLMLATEGLALANMGDIAYQTMAGAISTSTHGTGVQLPGLAGQVQSFRLLCADGTIKNCSLQENPEIFQLGRVSLGALGVVVEYSLKVVEAFRLRAQEVPMKLNDVLNNIDELVTTNDHFEFFWIPHTRWALTKRNNRTTDPLAPLPKVRGWIEKTFMENYAFGALCHVGRLRPSLIPRLATALPSSGSREYVNDSYKIFASPRLVRFYEMEHSIPADHLSEALREVVAMIDHKKYLLNFPVEVRFTAADDVALSTSYGRVSAYIAVHVFKGMEYEPFFRDVEDIMRRYNSRPHWGKVHHRESGELATLYPRFNEFVDLRNRLDPTRTFANKYTRQVLGE